MRSTNLFVRSLNRLPRATALAGALLAGLSAATASAQEIWTLARAIDHALTNSPSARIAAHRIRAARAITDQADSALWPRLQFEGSYSWTDVPMMAFGSILNQRAFSPNLDFNDVPAVDNLSARGIVSVPLYTGGQVSAGRRAADQNFAAAQQDSAAVRNSLAFEVARVFHTVFKTRAFIEAGEAAVQSFENNLEIARKRNAAGTLLKAEVLDVEVRLAQAREDLVRARNARALTERALANLLGLEQTIVTVADTPPEPALPDAAAGVPRPELQALDHREQAAESALRGARGGYLPKVSAFGSLQYERGWEMDGEGTYWMAGALVQWDLWDGRLSRAKVAEAQANLDELREQQRRARLAIAYEVEQARLNLAEADQRLGVTATAIAQAEESVQLTRARFEQGLALASQLIDAETALTAARVRRAEAEADRRIAVAALRQALGLPQLDSPTTSQ